jgi:hypothetical protein
VLARVLALLALVALLVAACGGDDDSAEPAPPAAAPPANELPYGPPPAAPDGPLDPEIAASVEDLFGNLEQTINRDAIRAISEAGDPRLAWLFAELLRFIPTSDLGGELVVGFEKLTGTVLSEAERFPTRAWSETSNRLIAWDTPAPPNYRELKGQLYTLIEPGWEPFFADADSDIDWRWIAWGGVPIDDRALGTTRSCPRGCIPAIDDPGVTDAASGTWYADDAIVFGVVVNEEARAYPKHIMEVHEMVNDTLGGRRIGMPYCTLCGSAQAYFTDTEEGELLLRTSGLLSRSNKVMYDLRSKSVFDTFTGQAVAGPLQDAGVALGQITVSTSTWGEWKAAHPDTTIVAEDGGIGRTYPLDPLQGRDDDGPIFPVGDVDPRLAVQERVVGVISPRGTPIAFPVATVRVALEAGEVVELDGVFIEQSAGGFRAVGADGGELVAHEAFWFAWSQFMPDTEIWVSSAP